MNLFVINGNALQIPLADKSVNMVVTSPPYYGLRDYGTGKWDGGDPECDHLQTNDTRNPRYTKQTQNAGTSKLGYKTICLKCGAIRIDNQIGLEQTPDEYVQKMVQVFREVWRVMKDDGTLWLNLGDSYASMKSRYSQKAQSLNGGKSQDNEFVGNKPDLYHHKDLGLKEKDLIGIPWRVAFALQADGWYLRSDIIWHKPNPMPESVKDRPTKSHEYIFLLTKQAKYYYNYEATMELSEWAEFDKLADGNGKHLSGGKSKENLYATNGISYGKKYSDGKYYRNKRSVWTVPTKPYKGAHFATFPQDLIIDCIKAGSKPGGLVLDPFNGSGTTGKVCARYGRNYIGVELNREYIGLTNERLMQYKIQPELI